MKRLFAVIAAFAWTNLPSQAQTATPSAASTPSPAVKAPASATPAPAPSATPPQDGATAPAAAATPPAQARSPLARPIHLAPLIYNAPKSAKAVTGEDGDGGSRGGGTKLASLYVLAPKHTGLTTRAQPSLFWYQSGPANTRFELTLIEPKKPKPLLKVIADKADQPGIHRISLGRYKVTLAPGVTYRWSVALVPNLTSRSQDVIAIGRIQRITPDAKLAASLSSAQGLEKAALYAGNGFWYDALESVSDEINASEKNKEIRRERSALLDQVGLKVAAADDRQ